MWGWEQDWLSENKDKAWRKYDDADYKEEIGDHVTRCACVRGGGWLCCLRGGRPQEAALDCHV